MTRIDCLRFALLASTALSAPALAGDRLPTGASVAHGGVDISTPSANAMAIRQSSDTAIVNWRGFSIGDGARVDIRQPSTSSAMLNRVTGSTPSSIAGQLNANGQVYLINPNGIAITPTGTVRTGAFVASTLATTDADFIAGRRVFRGDGRSAAVSNAGSIEVGPGGYAALIGGKVENSGQITARMGKIGLGAGEQATLDLSGDGFLAVAVPSDPAPGDDDPLITHSGRLSADGGRVEIKAATARQMARQVINLSGVVEARSVSGRSGAIVLGGGDGGRVRVSGRLDARAARAEPEPLAAIAPPPPRPGGSITVTGAAIELAGAALDASGPGGGGSVRIGGDWQGGGDLPRAATTSVDAATTIAADALASGDGGRVVVWSDEHTAFAGRISARGGPLGGDGGDAEVSGKALLSFSGQVDLSAPAGRFGTLLLDPFNVFIEDGATSDGVDEDISDDVDPTITLTPTANDTIINATEIEGILEAANVTIQTSFEGEGDQAGDITVDALLSWDSAALLTLETASGDITINFPITPGDGGGLATSTSGTTAVNAAITLGAGGSLDIDSGEIAVKAPITLGSGATLDVSGTTVDLDAIAAGDNAVLGVDADDSPLTINGAVSLGTGVSLDLAGGGVTLNGALTAGDAAGISVDSGGNPDDGGNLIALNGAWSVGDGADLFLDASDGVTVAAAVSFGEAGDLTIDAGTGLALDADLAWGAGSDVEVFAGGDIALSAALNGPAGDLDIGAGGAIAAGGSVDVGTFTFFAGDWTQVAAALPAFSAADFRIEDSEAGDASFLRALGGDGAAASPWLVADAYGLQGVGSADTIGATLPDLADSYALANDIDASDTSGWNDVEGAEGFDPIGALFDDPFSGSLDGQGFEIAGLFIDRPFADGVGLFAHVSGSVENLDLTGVDVTGGAPTGGLAGLNEGAIEQVSVAGAVVGASPEEGDSTFYAGGIAGENAGEISQSSSAAAVTLNAQAGNLIYAGGVAGLNSGEITDVVASGDVTANGADDGGGVTGAGGLVGQVVAGGTLTRVAASGDVAANGVGAFPIAGGLVGDNAGAILQAYAGATTETDPTGPGSIGGLAGENSGSIAQAFATGLVNTGVDVDGGLVGVNDGTVTGSFWDTTTTGQDGSDGGAGLATADFQNPDAFIPQASAAGWDFETTWAPPSDGFYPELYTISPVVRVDVDDKTRQYGLDNPPLTSTEFGGPESYVFDAPDDTLDTDALLTTDADATSGVALSPYAITTSADEATSADGVVYRLVTTDGELTVTPAPLTVIADDQTKQYGEGFAFGGDEFTTDPATPLFNDDAVTSATIASPAELATAPAGAHTIAISDAVGVGLENYDIDYESGDFTVSKAPLEIIANNQQKTYGQTFVFQGDELTTDPAQLFNDDAVNSATLTSPAAPATAGAGSYLDGISISDALGIGLENYVIDYEFGDFVVNKAPLTVIANDQQKTYGQTFIFQGDEFTTNPAQLFNDDAVTSATLTSPAAPATAGAGSYLEGISISDALGVGLGNYTISYESGDFVVDTAPLTITANDQRKTYGSAFAFRGDEFTAAGLVNADKVDSVTLTSAGAAATANVAGGPYAIQPSDAEGSGLSNYSITYAAGALTVDRKALTITADDQRKTFGQPFTFAGSEFSSNGLVNGDRITLATLGSTGAPASAPASDTPYAISVSDAQGDVANYDITYVAGDLLVVPQDLTFDAGLRVSFATDLANPADVIQISDTRGFTAASGGPSLGAGASGGPIAAREQAQEVLTFLESLSDELEDRIAACGAVPFDTDVYLGCVEEALSDYARDLDSRILDLPEPLRQVSAEIRQSASRIDAVRADAARRIAAATSDAEIEAIRRDALAEAGAAVETALVDIREAIALIRAEDDPELASLQAQQGATITAALQNVEDELTQAVGI